MANLIITGNLVDIFQQKIYPVEILVENKRIISILSLNSAAPGSPYILPGFIDAHVHIESSMLVPAEFARLAVVHGTVATVSDPHEIANVCGIEGVNFMIGNGRQVPFKFYFGAPSCVPATAFETAGAELNSAAVKELLQRPEIKYLSEMMNFPGVLHGDEEVMKKIAAARQFNKPVDGHAPGLRGEEAKKYIDAGISTDHECFTREEALDKLKYGMKVIIREGSAAKNFDALVDLLNDYPEQMMFCSDDKHPDSLAEGHINQLCERAVAKGINVYKVLRAACVNPVLHYNLDVGLLRKGDPADFILISDLKEFKVLQTYVDGELVAEEGKSLVSRQQYSVNSRQPAEINNFSCSIKQVNDFEVGVSLTSSNSKLTAIEALDGQLITNKVNFIPTTINNSIVCNLKEDIIKIVVVNRYGDAPVAKAFIKNFGLKQGALASSVAHDSHNIVAVGTDDESLCKAVNMVIEHKGGVSCVKDNFEMVLPLPVAGLMSNEDGYKVAELYSIIDKAAKEAGSTLSAPFMTLSFMALLVIPHLKLSDKGLFDGDRFMLI
ncbi:MAG: adenine deaminase [Chitinophagaceae bacterium]|nr:adenine deaminase [Chitinophagaceae bacterium]